MPEMPSELKLYRATSLSAVVGPIAAHTFQFGQGDEPYIAAKFTLRDKTQKTKVTSAACTASTLLQASSCNQVLNPTGTIRE